MKITIDLSAFFVAIEPGDGRLEIGSILRALAAAECRPNAAQHDQRPETDAAPITPPEDDLPRPFHALTARQQDQARAQFMGAAPLAPQPIDAAGSSAAPRQPDSAAAVAEPLDPGTPVRPWPKRIKSHGAAPWHDEHGETWIDAAGVHYRPDLHGWNRTRGEPAVSAHGKFRARRGGPADLPAVPAPAAAAIVADAAAERAAEFEASLFDPPSLFASQRLQLLKGRMLPPFPWVAPIAVAERIGGNTFDALITYLDRVLYGDWLDSELRSDELESLYQLLTQVPPVGDDWHQQIKARIGLAFEEVIDKRAAPALS